MKRIKQINETKELVFNAYIKLLNEKEEKDITLSEIAKTAGVGRMTLYRHFKEKDDILLYRVEINYTKAKELLNGENLTLYEVLHFRFKIFSNTPYLKTLYKMNKFQRVLNTFRRIYAEDINQFVQKENDQYESAFIWAGLDAITNTWIKSGMKEKPEAMAKKTIQIIRKYFPNIKIMLK